jgi:hypothetical protein
MPRSLILLCAMLFFIGGSALGDGVYLPQPPSGPRLPRDHPSCTVGLGTVIPYHHLGCGLCSATPEGGTRYQSFICESRGRATPVGTCGPRPRADCPDVPIPVCVMREGYLKVGERGCQNMGFPDKVTLFECIGRPGNPGGPAIRAIAEEIPRTDPRCTVIFDPR